MRRFFNDDLLQTRAKVLYIPGKGYFICRLWDDKTRKQQPVFGFSLLSAQLFDPTLRIELGQQKRFLTRRGFVVREYTIYCPVDRAEV